MIRDRIEAIVKHYGADLPPATIDALVALVEGAVAEDRERVAAHLQVWGCGEYVAEMCVSEIRGMT